MNGTRMEYTGPIPELQGKQALVRTIPQGDRMKFVRPDALWYAQFDGSSKWQPAPRDHFTPVADKPVFGGPQLDDSYEPLVHGGNYRKSPTNKE